MEGRSASFCGPKGDKCVVHPTDEDLTEIETIFRCCRPDPNAGNWVELCNSRLKGLIQDSELVFNEAGFWPANVQIREEMEGSDADEGRVTIEPPFTSEDLAPVAIKILQVRDKWAADQIASSGLGQPGNLKTARGGEVGGGASMSLPIGGGVASGFINNGVPHLPACTDISNAIPMKKRISSYSETIFPGRTHARVGLPGLTFTDPGSESIRLDPRKIPIFDFIVQVENVLLLVGGCYCHGLTQHSIAELGGMLRDQIWQHAHQWKKMEDESAGYWTGVLPALVTDRKTDFLFEVLTRWIKVESPARIWERFKQVLAEGLFFDRCYEKLGKASSGKQRDDLAWGVLEEWWSGKEVDRVQTQMKRKVLKAKEDAPAKSGRGRKSFPATPRVYDPEADHFEVPETWLGWGYWGSYNPDLPADFPKMRDMHQRACGGGPLLDSQYSVRDPSSNRDTAKFLTSPAGASINPEPQTSNP